MLILLISQHLLMLGDLMVLAVMMFLKEEVAMILFLEA